MHVSQYYCAIISVHVASYQPAAPPPAVVLRHTQCSSSVAEPV